jgi:hypothetical protein
MQDGPSEQFTVVECGSGNNSGPLVLTAGLQILVDLGIKYDFPTIIDNKLDPYALQRYINAAIQRDLEDESFWKTLEWETAASLCGIDIGIVRVQWHEGSNDPNIWFDFIPHYTKNEKNNKNSKKPNTQAPIIYVLNTEWQPSNPTDHYQLCIPLPKNPQKNINYTTRG